MLNVSERAYDFVVFVAYWAGAGAVIVGIFNATYRRDLFASGGAALSYLLFCKIISALLASLFSFVTTTYAAWTIALPLSLVIGVVPSVGVGCIADSVTNFLSAGSPSQLQVPVASNPPNSAVADAPRATAGAMVTTAFDNAGAVQTWWEAQTNTWQTDAQITALHNAERLAAAAAQAAAAEAQAIDAVIHRADKLTELHMRQVVEDLYRNERIAVTGQKLALADLRREKERYELKREALAAKHSVDATREFKRVKFDIGKARARARQNDAEVDSKTAEAAVLRIATELAKLSRSQGPGVEHWLDQQIALTETTIEDGEADGQDTSAKRAELAMLRRLRGAAGAAA